MSKYSLKLLKAYRALSEWIVRSLGQPPLWPRNLVEWAYYLNTFFPKECYLTISRLESEKGLTIDQIAKLFKTPSGIGNFFYLPETHFGVKEEYWARGLTVDEGIRFLEKIVDIISALRRGDAFCRDFKNLLISNEEANNIARNLTFIEVTPSLAQLSSRVNVVLGFYATLLNGGIRSFSQEFHGPYEVNDEILFIREYFNLRPTEVWSFSSIFPYDRIIFYEIYSNVRIYIDPFNHYWFSAYPFKRLKKVAIKVNDEFLTETEDVAELYEECLKVLRKGQKIISTYTQQDWARKWIQMACFWLKPLKDVLREPWKPSPDILRVADDPEEGRKAIEYTLRYVNMIRKAASLPKREAMDEITLMYLKTIYNEW